jgi:hypothetical protein
MNYKEIGKDIYLFKKLLTKKECDFIIETVEKFPAWEDAKTLGDLEEYRKTQVDYLTNRYGENSQLYKAHSIIGYNFKIAFEMLMDIYKNEEMNKSYLAYNGDEGVQILKYCPNQFYKEHIDSASNMKRMHSCILYLNNEYEGGNTEFKRQKVSLKAEIGDLVIFPSFYTHPHCSQEIKSGNKYVAVIWSF